MTGGAVRDLAPDGLIWRCPCCRQAYGDLDAARECCWPPEGREP